LDFFDEKDIELQSSCLEEILCNDKEHKLISINQFGAIVEWYGPLKISKDDNLLKRILLFCKSPWFHCDMEREGAIDLLKKKKKKHFLVRLNHKSDIRKMHPMTLSYSYNSETHHTRILYVQEEESDKKIYKISISDSKGDHEFFNESLFYLVENIQKDMNWKSITETTSYITKYFQPVVVNGYDPSFMDDDFKKKNS